MAKRVTCLVLALVMALLCVPVFALSVFAAAQTPKTHTTSWRENMPATTDDPASIGYLVEYPENAAWFIGSLNRDSLANFIPFNYRTTADTNRNLICGNTWTETNSEEIEKGNIWPGDQWINGGFYIATEEMITPLAKNTTVRYVAEYTGTATVSVTELYFALKAVEGITDGAPNHAFAIFQNGTMVWPTEGGSYTGFTDWYDPKVANANVAGEIDALTLSLHAGDALDFVFAYDRDTVTGESVRGAYDFDATVAYTSITEELFGSIKTVYADDVMFWQDTRSPLFYYNAAGEPDFASREAYGEYLEKFMTVRYDGNWSLGVMLGNTGKYEPLARRMFFASKNIETVTEWDTAWGVTESFFQQELASYLAGNTPNVWGGDYSGSSHRDNVCFVQPAQPWTAMTYAYRVPADGVLSLRFDQISTPTNEGGMRVCVLVDGYMVWPKKGGTLGDASNRNYEDWYPIKQNDTGFLTTLNEKLAAVQPYVTAGSLVEFCVGKGNNWAGSNAFGNGYVVNPALTLSPDEPDEPDASGKRCVVTYVDVNGKVVDRYECRVGDPFPEPSLLGLYDLNGDGAPDTLPKTVSGSVAVVAVELLGQDAFSASVPTINATGDGADFHGNWTIGKGTWSTDALTSRGATWTHTYDFTKYEDPAFVVTPGSLWNADGGGMYTYRKFAARTVSSKTGIGAIYTAPYSGTVDLSFAELIGRRELSGNEDQAGNPNMGGLSLPIAYYVSILKNGEVVWPTDASAFLFETEQHYTSEKLIDGAYTNTAVDADFLEVPLQREAPAWPTDIPVEAGDEIAFIVNQGNVACWMCYMDPVVSYTSVDTSGAEVESASITLGEAFAVNYYLTSSQADITEMGVELEDGTYLRGEKQEGGTWKVTVGGIAARELVDSVLVTPIAKSADAEWRGMPTGSSPAKLLEAYVTEETEDAAKAAASDLAIATLNYAAAAQTYFGYKTDTLANADLTEAQKAVTVTGTYEGHYAFTPMEDASGKVFRLHGMTLLLEDTVSVKLLATGEAGLLDSATYYVRLTANDMSTYVPLVPCEGEGSEGAYKAIFEGLTPLAWNTAYTLTICYGDNETAAEVSASVTYSVTTYAVRTQENPDVKPVTDAMLALYEAALAYAAPQNPGE